MQRKQATHFDVAGTVVHGCENELGRSRPGLNLPRLLWPFSPLLLGPCCLTDMACVTAARICLCELSLSSARCSRLTLGVASAVGAMSWLFAASNAAASSC